MKRAVKIILIIFTILIIVFGSLPLIMQTRPFKNWLAGFIENSVNKGLHAQLSIGRIDGNFFSHVKLSDLTLTFDQDTIAAIPSLDLRYHLKSALKKKVVISSIRIDSPAFYIYQLPDSSWVFDHLLPTPSRPPDGVEESPADSSAFDWTIELEQLALTNLSARIAALDSLIPRQIGLDMLLSGRMTPDAKTLHLHDMSARTVAPDFQLSSLTLSLEQTRLGLTLNDFALRTAKNQLRGSAALNDTAPLRANAAIRTDPLDLSEFRFLLPSIHIKGQPKLEVTGHLQNDSLTATLKIMSARSGIDVRAAVGNFSHLLGDSIRAEPSYDIAGSLANVSLADWPPNLDKSIVINGVLSVKGSGITAATAQADIDVQLERCELERRHIERLSLSSSYSRGSVEAQLDLLSDMGGMNAVARVRDVTSRQIYSLALNCSDLDLAAIAQDSILASDLNFDLTAAGRSFSPQDMIADGSVRLRPSRFYDVAIDTIDAVVHMAKGDISITSLQIQSSGVQAEAHGTLSLDSASDLSITAKTDNFKPLGHFIGADSLGGAASISAHLGGRLDSLLLTGSIEASELAYETQKIDSLLLDFHAQRVQEELVAAAHAKIKDIDVGNVLIHDVELQADVTPERIDLRTSLLQGDDIRARLHAQYYLYDLPIIYIKELDVDLRDRQWRGGSEETSILLGDGEYIVTDFLIERIDGDTSNAQIYLDGTVRLRGEEDLQLRIQNYHLAPIAEFLKDHPALDGLLNLDIKLAGTADEPRLDVKTTVTDIKYNAISVKTLNGSIIYDENQIVTDILVIPHANNLTVKGMIPAHFSVADQSFRLYENEPFNVAVKMENISLENIYAPNEFIDNIGGILNVDIRAENTISDIAPVGVVSIDDGRFKNDKFGIALDDLDMKLLIKPDSLVLRQFKAAQDGGWIDIKGFAALDSSLFTGVLKTLHLNVNANKFYLSKKPEHEIQIDARIEVNGPPDALRFAGNLEIVRSSFYLPALTGQSGKRPAARETPLLIQALSDRMDSLAVDTTVTVTAKKEAPPLLKNMRGSLKVKIPRNTWFKSDNMRVEISGDVDVVKNSDVFELFGPIVILRGQYDFLARRFKVSEGTVSFQGGETINPMLDVTAEYTFRDSNKDKRTIYLIVTDEAMNPDITFKLDDNNITEGEAVAYILFNRSPDEMSGQTEAGSPPRYLATDLVYGMMSAELSRRFGQQIGVDYIEIKGEDNLNTATFIVGKYITPDLFMSYEHSFGALEEDRPPQVVTVEYQLTKYLFFQLVSGDTKTAGVDIIVKFDR
ncbi:translocation/assembly module TamB domain-containing protein [candidate division KSB1 bacterium]|nr:translocation/assembly module TamB domain-containing protein [candidate division KSB1 bacterium]